MPGDTDNNLISLLLTSLVCFAMTELKNNTTLAETLRRETEISIDYMRRYDKPY